MPRTRDGTRIGIDTGGTFTDVAVLDAGGGALRVHKVPSTPSDPAAAVLHGLAAVRRDEPVDVVHGTTVGLNAILTGHLARTAFVTNTGFVDLVEIGRQERAGLYDLRAARPELPVPRELRVGIDSRRTAQGRRLRRPAAAELDRLLDRLRRARVEAVAIGLLHSYAHPGDEREVARHLAALGVPITCSGELLPVHGEYERFAAAILNAALAPLMGSYLEQLEQGIGPGRLRRMRSSGGAMPAREARRHPARAVFSGPAGGVVAARRLAQALRLGTVASLDMGGTSSDVSLIASERDSNLAGVARTVAGLPLAVASVDVHTIGCGGGSIARVDRGGALVVGPDSAGADPGPACYGRGGALPTVTDAHLVLGHLGADSLLQGAFPVDPQRSVAAIAALAARLGTDLRRAAAGILEIAEVAMMRALLVITVQRSLDPARVPLIAFGGAGGLHAAHLMQRLSMPLAVVPSDPGAFSAMGLALAGESHEEVASVLLPLERVAGARLQQLARRLAMRARSALGSTAQRPLLSVDVRLRFFGQGAGLWLPLRGELEAAFRRRHRQHFGFVPEASAGAVEVVELRARAETAGRALSRPRQLRPSGTRLLPRALRRPPAGGRSWRVFARSDLASGDRLDGPCVIEELTGAVLVPAGFEARVTGGHLLLNR
jgi:N-methylhydantoinase A